MDGHALWWRWVRWTTAGEVAGFAAPAAVGVATSRVDGVGTLVALVLAGLVEGAALGAAQAHVMRDVVPGLRASSYALATSAAAGLAYAIGMAPSTFHDSLGDLPPLVLAFAGALAGIVLLGSIGTAQWLVLRRVLPGSGRWVVATGVAWLLGLAVFLAVATPLWQEGQDAVVTWVIGLAAAVLMAFAVAAVTGVALVRMVKRLQAPPPAVRARSSSLAEVTNASLTGDPPGSAWQRMAR